MNIAELVKTELRETLVHDTELQRWFSTLIPINLWSVTEWEPVQVELDRLQAAGYISEIIEVSGEAHDDDDILYPVLTAAGLAYLESP